HYEAQRLPMAVAGGGALPAPGICNKGWAGPITMGSTRPQPPRHDHGKMVYGRAACTPKRAMVLAALCNRSSGDLLVNGSLCRNGGRGNLQPASALAIPKATALAQADFDNDGRVDLAVVTEDGSLELLRNDTPTTSHSLRVQLEGVKNLK